MEWIGPIAQTTYLKAFICGVCGTVGEVRMAVNHMGKCPSEFDSRHIPWRIIMNYKCPGCQRQELHKFCPAYGTHFYMSGIPFTIEIQNIYDILDKEDKLSLFNYQIKLIEELYRKCKQDEILLKE